MEADDDIIRRVGAQRLNISRLSFAMPREGIQAEELSLVSGLCLGGTGSKGFTTGMPGPDEDVDIEVEIHIKATPRESA